MIKAVICDDEAAAQNIIRHFIEMNHYPIEIAGTAANGRDAMALLERERPDLVFMDIQMPYMNGFDVIERMSAGKVIVITAYDSFAYAQKALRLGASDIIAKPIDLEQLKGAIERAVGWRFTGNEIADLALSYIYGHYREQIELKTLSELCYCSESHLARVFKKATGMSVIACVHRVRIDQSMKLLREGKVSIKEAAENVGYRNINQFYKYFEAQSGMTPAAWMKAERT